MTYVGEHAVDVDDGDLSGSRHPDNVSRAVQTVGPEGRLARVLVTGMSGTGKSTVLAELGRRGHRVVDADDDAWAEQVASCDAGGANSSGRGPGERAAVGGRPRHAVRRRLCRQPGQVLRPLDAVVLLSVPLELMLERLERRTTNQFGKDPAERDRILRDLRTVEPLLRAPATVEISTDGSPSEVADALEGVAAEIATGEATLQPGVGAS